MSILHGWEGSMPHQVRGKVKRTSGRLDDDGPYVLLHVEEIEGRNKGTEAPLTFRLDAAQHPLALMAAVGDIVSIEWIPDKCKSDPRFEPSPLAFATRFHLSRKVAAGYGSGFDKPAWQERSLY